MALRETKDIKLKIPGSQHSLTTQQALNLAVHHHNAGNFQKARGIYQQILQAEPNQPIALHLLGVIFHQVGENVIAEEFITKALSIKPKYAEACNNLGMTVQELGRLDDAIVHYHQALKIKPDFAEAFNSLGTALRRLGRLNEAVANYHNALTIKPNYAEALNNLGNVLRKLGQLNEAKESYHKALFIKSDFVRAHNNLGAVLQDLGKLDEAVTSYQMALVNEPNDVEAHKNLGTALQELGRLDEAIASCQKAISIEPGDAEVFNNTWLCLQPMCHEVITNHREASSIERLIESLPTSPELDIIRLQFRSMLGKDTQEAWKSVMHHLPTAQSETINNQNITSFPSVGTVQKNSEIKMVALLHFGRSGSGFLHSLLDNHPNVSTLPGIYMSGFFGREVWNRIGNSGFQGISEQYSLLYKVLFDARCPDSIPPAFINDSYTNQNVGLAEGFINMGQNRDTPLTLERARFVENLGKIVSDLENINHGQLFEAIHHAYEKTLGNDFGDKRLIFYHLHKYDPYSMANFLKYFPKTQLLTIIRNPLQSCESWVLNVAKTKQENKYKFYAIIVSRIISMLVNLNCPAFLTQDCAAVRLEDLKTKPRETMRRLCIYLNIEHEATLYQSTMQGMKWWGDPSSNLFGRTHDTDSWKDDPIRAEIGTFFSATDQYILGTLFYPLSTQFEYVQQNNPKFRDDLAEIRPLLDKPLNFEKTLAEKFLPGYPELEMTSAFKSLHALLIGRWSILEKYGTYPNMPKPLPN